MTGESFRSRFVPLATATADNTGADRSNSKCCVRFTRDFRAPGRSLAHFLTAADAVKTMPALPSAPVALPGLPESKKG